MVHRNLRQAYLQEVGLTQISGDRDFLKFFLSFFLSFLSAGRISIQSRFHNRFQVVLHE